MKKSSFYKAATIVGGLGGVSLLSGCAVGPTTPPAPVYAAPVLTKVPNGPTMMLGANLNQGPVLGNQTTWFAGPVNVSAPQEPVAPGSTTTTVPVPTIVNVKKDVPGHYQNEQVGSGTFCKTERVWVKDHFIVVPATVVVPETVTVPAAPAAPVQNGNMAPAQVVQTAGVVPIVGGTAAELLSGAGDVLSGTGALEYGLHYKPDSVNVSANNSGVSAAGGSATGGAATGGSATGGSATGGAGGEGGIGGAGGSAASSSISGAQSTLDSKVTNTNTNTNTNINTNKNQNANDNYNQNQNYNNNNNQNWNTAKNTVTNNNGQPKPSKPRCGCANDNNTGAATLNLQ